MVATGTTNIMVADQPKEIGDSSDMVIICVKDYQAVANVSLMTGGLIETTNPDLIVIQTSTISPEESNKVADLYSNKHIRMLSVPMLRGDRHRHEGRDDLQNHVDFQLWGTIYKTSVSYTTLTCKTEPDAETFRAH
jgi:3-hydroxyisobutyrate dehydrogenase-like beta-hydroxyacid dehydrogenase